MIGIVVGVVTNDELPGLAGPFPVQEVVADQEELLTARPRAQDVEEEVETEVKHLQTDEAFGDGDLEKHEF